MLYFLKGFLRALIRIIIETIHRLLINLYDTLLGYLGWPKKKIHIKIFILPAEQNPTPADPGKAIDYAKDVFKKNFNVELKPAGNNESFTEILKTIPPREALYTSGGSRAFREEFKVAGNFFASNLVAPLYPVTIFIVKDIKGARGCSLGPMTDYITLDHDGVKDVSILAHELAHACGLWHLDDQTNLLWNKNNRGDKIRWWQKNIFRSSRHVTYW
jgi:hypothetical protein